jgi:short-subunit dehydrogenase
MNLSSPKTVVITGASSGIGKAIALTLAKRGMNLVLAARRDTLLQEVASECESLGASAVGIRTDVTKFEDLVNLMNKAKVFFGEIDIWINNAGVMAVGEFNVTPVESHEQVIKINLLGPLYGSYAVLPYFKERGKGIIINTVSIGAFIPTPFASSYAASKFGVRGLDEALRGELEDYHDIHICDVNPYFTDTPGIFHVANYSGKKLQLAPPVYDPFQVAEVVSKLIDRPKPNVMVGGAARLVRFLHALSPNLLGKALARSARAYFKFARPAPLSSGSLFSPVLEGEGTRAGNTRKPSVWKWMHSKEKPFLEASSSTLQ